MNPDLLVELVGLTVLVIEGVALLASTIPKNVRISVNIGVTSLGVASRGSIPHAAG